MCCDLANSTLPFVGSSSQSGACARFKSNRETLDRN
jgi:hypothetical protein